MLFSQSGNSGQAADPKEPGKFILKDHGFGPEEIVGMAEIHASEIKKGFLTSLGQEPLRLLYEFARRFYASLRR